jgi:pyruvate,orthophosphate dikinase
MMDTILNLGLNDEAVEGLAAATGNPRFACDSYRRSSRCTARSSTGSTPHRFEDALSAAEGARGAQQDVDLTADDLAELVGRSSRSTRTRPAAVPAGRRASSCDRAVRARLRLVGDPARAGLPPRARDPDDLGTAVNVVQMVFGNKGDRSGTGVCFTRDPSTGEAGVYGEFLADAQGEDVVAGIRTPEPLAGCRTLPHAYEQLLETMRGSRSTTATCRTSSSRSRTSGSTSSRPGAPSAPPRPR